MDAAIIGRRLRESRMRRQMSVAKLAQLSRLARSTVQRIERGKALPCDTTLAQLASVLGVTVDVLKRPSQARTRVAVNTERDDASGEVPYCVVKVLCTGRLGKVTAKELTRLVRNAHDDEYNSDPGLLELDLLFRRACSAMHDAGHKQAFDNAFERIRREMSH